MHVFELGQHIGRLVCIRSYCSLDVASQPERKVRDTENALGYFALPHTINVPSAEKNTNTFSGKSALDCQDLHIALVSNDGIRHVCVNLIWRGEEGRHFASETSQPANEDRAF